jgi:hypothetical protein
MILIRVQLSFTVGKHACLPPPFLNQYILTLPIKTPVSMRLHVQRLMTHDKEMNDQIFNVGIELNMRDIARNAM